MERPRLLCASREQARSIDLRCYRGNSFDCLLRWHNPGLPLAMSLFITSEEGGILRQNKHPIAQTFTMIASFTSHFLETWMLWEVEQLVCSWRQWNSRWQFFTPDHTQSVFFPQQWELWKAFLHGLDLPVPHSYTFSPSGPTSDNLDDYRYPICHSVAVIMHSSGTPQGRSPHWLLSLLNKVFKSLIHTKLS